MEYETRYHTRGEYEGKKIVHSYIWKIFLFHNQRVIQVNGSQMSRPSIKKTFNMLLNS